MTDSLHRDMKTYGTFYPETSFSDVSDKSSYPAYGGANSPVPFLYSSYPNESFLHSDLEVTSDSDRHRPRSVPRQEIASSVNNVSTTASGYVESDENDIDDVDIKSGWCNFTKTQLIVLISLCTSQVCNSMFYALLAPFFPTEGVSKGASPTEVGFILGIFQAIVFLTSPIYGKYMTVIGPKFMYVCGIFSTSTCAILFGILQWCPNGTVYVVMCFLTRTVEALACSAVSTANLTIAATTFKDALSTVMGVLQACSCVGLMVGPPVGGLLYSAGGFFLPFAVTGGAYFLCGFFSWKFLPSLKAEEKVEGGPSRWHLLRIPVILFVGYLVVIGQSAIGFCDVALADHFNEFHLSPAIVGLLFLIPSGSVIILAPINGWIVDKNSKYARIILIAGCVIGSIGFLGVGPSPLITAVVPPNVLWIVIVALAVCGVGMSCLVVTYPEFITAARENNFPDSMETKGLVSGVYNSMNSLGSFLGPTVGGVLLEHFHFPWSSTVFAGATILAAVLLFVYTIYERCSCPCQCAKPEDGELLINPE